jgi:hypothetical protein
VIATRADLRSLMRGVEIAMMSIAKPSATHSESELERAQRTAAVSGNALIEDRALRVGALHLTGAFVIPLCEGMGDGSTQFQMKVTSKRSGAHSTMKVSRITQFGNWKLGSSLSEVRVLSAVNHEHMVRLIGAVASPTHLAIWMPHCGGATLLRRAEAVHWELPLDTVRAVFGQVFGALEHLRRRRVVHRNVSLESLRFKRSVRDITEPYCHASEWQVCLCDFGFAVFTEEDGPHTLSGVGSAPYRAPECVSQHECGAPMDAWSAGVALWAILSGGFFPFGSKQTPILWGRIVRGQWARALTTPDASTVALLCAVLCVDPSKRASPADALSHAWFAQTDDDGDDGDEALSSGSTALAMPALSDADCTPASPLSVCDGCHFRKATALCAVCRDRGGVASVGLTLSAPSMILALECAALRERAEAETNADETMANGLYIEAEGARRSVGLSELAELRKRGRVWPLTAAVIDALRRERKVVIEGNSGSGKSLFLRNLERALWRDFDCAVADARVIPVFVSLPRHFGRGTLGSLASSVLRQRGLSAALIESARFVFLFDAFDEIEQAYGRSRRIEEAFGLTALGESAKCVVSVRGGVVSASDRVRVFGSALTIHVCPFDRDRVDSLVSRFVRVDALNTAKWTYGQYTGALAEYGGLREMVSSPFLLRLMLAILPAMMAEDGDGSTLRAQVYEAFLSQWFEREARKADRSVRRDTAAAVEMASHFEWHMQRLALAMWRRGLTKVEQDGPLWRRFFVDSSYGLSGAVLLKGCALSRVGPMHWAFIHKSCPEYLLAMRIVDEVTVAASVRELQQSHLAFALNARLLNSEASVVSFIADRVREGMAHAEGQYASLCARLFATIQVSKTDPSVATAASNSATEGRAHPSRSARLRRAQGCRPEGRRPHRSLAQTGRAHARRPQRGYARRRRLWGIS